MTYIGMLWRLKMSKCEGCLNSFRIMSENGLHGVCMLSDKQALDCKANIKDRRVAIVRDDNGRYKVVRATGKCPI